MRARPVALVAGLLCWCVGCGDTGEGGPANRAGEAATTSASAAPSGSSPGTAPAGEPASGMPGDTTNAGSADGGRNVDSLVAAILACPRDGLWHACSLENRLRQFGLRAVEVDTQTYIPGVPQAARTWTVGGRTIRVVLLDDATADVVAATLDSARAAPKGDMSVVWPERVTLLHNANLLALYFGGSDRQVERISNAILGGPPQPEPDR